MNEEVKNEEVKEFDPFEATFSKHDQMNQEAENSQGFSGMEFEQIVYEGLAVSKSVIFRVLGYPAEYRKNPTDAKLIFQSKIIKDDGKGYIVINWPYVEVRGKYKPDPDWVLSKLMNKVLERKFVAYTEKDIDGKEVFVDASDGKIKNKRGYTGVSHDIHTQTESYNRIKNNKKKTETKNYRSFSPTPRVLMNILSRMDDWCKENKHSKVLSTKVGEQEVDDNGTKKKILYPETGISQTMYNAFLGYIRDTCRTWVDRDFIITRTHTNDMYSQTIVDATTNKLMKQGNPSLWPKISEHPTTEEELAYELFDFDNLFRVASYRKLKKNLSGLFKLYDAEFNDTLYEELVRLAQIEEQENKDNKASEQSDEADDNEPPFDADTPETATQEEVKKERKPREAVNASAVDLSILSFWSSLAKEDKEDMTKFTEKIENDELVFKANTALAPCIACNKPLPNTVLRCPFCDTEM